MGREKEAISEMLPYMRLGYVSDPAEMQSVISSQGPICPVSPQNHLNLISFYIDFLKNMTELAITSQMYRGIELINTFSIMRLSSFKLKKIDNE